ncbi:uncharacterized protein LOC131162730 [Malania oleifera]|uniref:uncharacterized protein LOC131162730 n=1 Tax=Malania oleifera TaxID=397392 RepID=UPI0025AE0F38|nr:uncharacterized protein LOC131162730 [Malania oleifera]
MNPPAFLGAADPIVVENWIQEMEKVLTVLHCTEEQRVLYATYKLSDEAESESKVQDFLSLTQESLTVQQYATKFIELSQFAPYIVSDEAKKARMFERGLRRDIYKQVVVLNMQGYSESVDRAIVGKESEQKDVGALSQRKRPTHPGFQESPSRGPWRGDWYGEGQR